MEGYSINSEKTRAYKLAIRGINEALQSDHVIHVLKRMIEKFELIRENDVEIDTYDKIINNLRVLTQGYQYASWSVENIREKLKKLKSLYEHKLQKLTNENNESSKGEAPFSFAFGSRCW